MANNLNDYKEYIHGLRNCFSLDSDFIEEFLISIREEAKELGIDVDLPEHQEWLKLLKVFGAVVNTIQYLSLNNYSPKAITSINLPANLTLTSTDFFNSLSQKTRYQRNKILHEVCSDITILDKLEASLERNDCTEFGNILYNYKIDTANLTRVVSFFDSCYYIDDFSRKHDDFEDEIACEYLLSVFATVNDSIKDDFDAFINRIPSKSKDRINELLDEQFFIFNKELGWLLNREVSIEEAKDGGAIVMQTILSDIDFFGNTDLTGASILQQLHSLLLLLLRLYVYCNNKKEFEKKLVLKASESWGIKPLLEQTFHEHDELMRSLHEDIAQKKKEIAQKFTIPEDFFSNPVYIQNHEGFGFNPEKIEEENKNVHKIYELIEFLGRENYIKNTVEEKYMLLFCLTKRAIFKIDSPHQIHWLREANVLYHIIKNLNKEYGRFDIIPQCFVFDQDTRGAEKLNTIHKENNSRLSSNIDLVSDLSYKVFASSVYGWAFKSEKYKKSN